MALGMCASLKPLHLLLTSRCSSPLGPIVARSAQTESPCSARATCRCAPAFNMHLLLKAPIQRVSQDMCIYRCYVATTCICLCSMLRPTTLASQCRKFIEPHCLLRWYIWRPSLNTQCHHTPAPSFLYSAISRPAAHWLSQVCRCCMQPVHACPYLND